MLGLILGTGSYKKEQINEVNVGNQELRVIKESGTGWKSWWKEWIANNKEGHRNGKRWIVCFSVGGSLKEDLLLCRICERMIPSSEMPVHNEECMRWKSKYEMMIRSMLAFRNDRQLKEFKRNMRTILKILSDSLKCPYHRSKEPTTEECLRGVGKWMNEIENMTWQRRLRCQTMIVWFMVHSLKGIECEKAWNEVLIDSSDSIQITLHRDCSRVLKAFWRYRNFQWITMG